MDGTRCSPWGDGGEDIGKNRRREVLMDKNAL
jgi:hypothetical protein